MNVTMYQPLPNNQMPPFQCIINQQLIFTLEQIKILLCPYMQYVFLQARGKKDLLS